jgi:biopolymer transport protein ExbB
MKAQEKNKSGKVLFSYLVIPVALLVAELVYFKILGDGSHFQGGNNENLPIPGDYLGTIYKGGFIVPILMTCLLTVITFSIERFFTIRKAAGKGSLVKFVSDIKHLLNEGRINEAIAVCDKQKGSVANVVRSVVEKYEQVENEPSMSKEQKIVDIQKTVEEATALELPSLQQNLVFLSTLTSASTLIGLLGTVMGMIRSFASMANAGAPDSVGLSIGISEALINTAFGIGSATVAVIMYNFFTTKIDKLTYSIDEAGYSIVQTFNAKH